MKEMRATMRRVSFGLLVTGAVLVLLGSALVLVPMPPACQNSGQGPCPASGCVTGVHATCYSVEAGEGVLVVGVGLLLTAGWLAFRPLAKVRTGQA
jgi:hypothetical protein